MNGNTPKSLQMIIADAQQALASWDDDEEDADEEGSLAAAKDWTARLGRGEYDQKLYWECVAEDCEAEGDWEGAKKAYWRVIELEASGERGFLSSHSDLAELHWLLGERRQALEHARRARKLVHSRQEDIAFRCAIDHEAWLLLLMGRTGSARRLVKRGLRSFDDDSTDVLGYAKLQTMRAACDVAARRALMRTTRFKSLGATWRRFASRWMLTASLRRRQGCKAPMQRGISLRPNVVG